MKLAFVILAALLFASPAFPLDPPPVLTDTGGKVPLIDTKIEEQRQIMSKIMDLSAMKDANDRDWAASKKQESNLIWAWDQIKPKIAQHQQEVSRWESAAAAHEARVADHNGRCSGTFDDANYVAACNAEAATGNANKARLEQERSHLQQMENLLNQNIATQREETVKLTARQKLIIAKDEQIKAQAQPLIARLKQLEDEINSCKNAIATNDPETMKARCGEMFDGNANRKSGSNLKPQPLKATPNQ